jgi:hypothetical protein
MLAKWKVGHILTPDPLEGPFGLHLLKVSCLYNPVSLHNGESREGTAVSGWILSSVEFVHTPMYLASHVLGLSLFFQPMPSDGSNCCQLLCPPLLSFFYHPLENSPLVSVHTWWC